MRGLAFSFLYMSYDEQMYVNTIDRSGPPHRRMAGSEINVLYATIHFTRLQAMSSLVLNNRINTPKTLNPIHLDEATKMASQKPVFTRLSSTRPRRAPSHTNLPFLAGLLLLLLPPAALLVQRPPFISYLLLAINAATYLVYRHDKRAAVRQDGSRRVSETTLHLWALAGGWPGAFVAQRVLRHKTRKVRFQAVFWAVVVLEEGVCLRALRVL